MFKKIIIPILAVMMLILPMAQVYAFEPPSLGNVSLNANKDNTNGNTSGSSSSSSSNTPKKTVNIKLKPEYHYVPTVDWTPIRQYYTSQWSSITSGGTKSPSGNIPSYQASPESWYVWKDIETNGSETIVTTHTVITPAIEVYFTQTAASKGNTENHKVDHYVWTWKGPAGGIKQNTWNTQSTTSAISFYQVGQYTITATPYETWDTYTKYTYRVTVKQGSKTMQTGFWAETVKTGTGAGLIASKATVFKLNITAQDLYKDIPIKNTMEVKNADVDIRFIE